MKNEKKIWLLKTEPEEFSFNDLVKKKCAPWDGVRNYQARKYLLAMKKGDLAFIYHTGKERAIIGLAEIAREAYPEKTPADTKGEWFQVDVKPICALSEPLALEAIKKAPPLKNMPLLKQSRLSVMPLTQGEFTAILELTKTKLNYGLRF